MPVLDEAVLAGLAVDIGEDGAREIGALFASQLPGQVARMQADLAAGNREAVAATAHVLAAGAGQVGAARLARYSRDLQVLDATAPPESAAALVAAVAGEAPRVSEALAAALERAGRP